MEYSYRAGDYEGSIDATLMATLEDVAVLAASDIRDAGEDSDSDLWPLTIYVYRQLRGTESGTFRVSMELVPEYSVKRVR